MMTISVQAAIGSKGLVIERGAECIELKKGEKRLLHVKDGFSGYPILKGLTFYSDNKIVATVGLHTGLLRANSPGTARITVIDQDGDAGTIIVRITSKKKARLIWLLFPVFILFLLYISIKRRK